MIAFPAGAREWIAGGVSPLAPTDGRNGVTLAAIYSQDRFQLTTSVNYTWLGDADLVTAGPDPVASMEDNHAWGIGMKLAVKF